MVKQGPAYPWGVKILASILFHENKDLSLTFYLGFGIILAVIFLNAFIKQRLNK